MAGKVSAKNAVITVDDSTGTPQIISGDVMSYEIEYDVNKQDVTGFGEGAQNFIPGLPVIGLSLDVFWNTTATTGARTVLAGILGSATSKTVSVVPEPGGPTFSGEFMLDALNVSSTPDGVIKIGTTHFSVMGAVAPAWA